MTPKAIIKGLIVIATLVAIALAWKASGLADHFDETWIDSEVRGRGLAGLALFVAMGAMGTGIGLPRQIVAFLGGYAFGFVEGTALALLATVLGCIGSFTYARLLGRSVVKRRFAGKIARVDAFLKENPFSMSLLIRLLPVGNNLITNLLAGVSSASMIGFVGGSALGYIPQMAVFALVGSGIEVDTTFRVSLSAALFVASGAIGVTLYRRYRHGLSFDEDLDRELGEAPDKDGPAPSTGEVR